MTFDPKHLMQLAAIIGAGSLGRAAEQQGMAQPGLKPQYQDNGSWASSCFPEDKTNLSTSNTLFALA